MEIKLTILASFFEEPSRKFAIRELSRILKINHTTIREYLNKLVKEEFLSVKKEGVYTFYKLLQSQKILNLKLYYNLEKLRKSNLINDLEKAYDFPVIILFGSYATARDDISSDVDICIISNIEKEFAVQKYENSLNRHVSIHAYTKSSFEKAKKTNPNLINSIINGIVLSGELEVL